MSDPPRTASAGAALWVVASFLWIAHSALMLVGLYGFLTMPLVGANGGSSTGATLWVAGYVGAFISILGSGVLFGVAMFLFAEGTAVRGTTIGGSRNLSSKHAKRAAGAFLGFSGVAGLALYAAVFVFLLGVAEAYLAVFYLSWAGSSALLVLAAIATSRFLSGLRPGIPSGTRHGLLLIAYSIVNVTGVLLFTLPYLLDEFVGASPPVPIGALGGMLNLIAIPGFGVVAFAIVALHGPRLRKDLQFAASGST